MGVLSQEINNKLMKQIYNEILLIFSNILPQIMIIKVTGSVLSNIFFGDNKYLDWLVPWSILIDTEMEHIIVSKRNYYFIGIDKEVVPFRNLRRISYDAHLFGADLNLKVYGTGLLSARCLKKNEAKKLYQFCLEEVTSNKKSTRIG